MYAQQQQLRASKGCTALPVLPTRRPLACARGRTARKTVAAAAPVEAPPAMPSSRYEPEDETTRPFPYPLPLDSAQKTLSSIPQALFYPALLAFVGGAGFIGSLAGRALPVNDETKDLTSIGAAAVLGAGAAYASVLAKKKRDTIAVVDLYNAIVELPDPSQLTEEAVAAAGSKYGINMQKDELDGLQRLYGQFLENVIPTGDTQLKGDEAERVIRFKAALGLSDEDAAPAHIDVARRMYRQGFETKDRQAQFEQRKGFQRLVYVSQIVFGDMKAAFLLPWQRHFTLTEAQLFVARRDNAKAIFRSQFEAQGGFLKADRTFLKEQRARQVAVKMMDESVEDLVKEYARKHVEERLTRALDAIKATGKNKDISTMVEEVTQVLDYSRKLAKYAEEGDVMPGLGHVTILGGTLADGSRARELKELYKAYLEEQMERANDFPVALDQDAKDLQAILVIGGKDAQTMRDEVAAKMYRRLLKEEVVSKRIDQAASPAAALQALCDKVRLGPEAAQELHKQLYRAKAASVVETGKMTDQDREDLARVRRILCITDEVAKKVARETSGKVLEDVMSDIFLGGAKPVPDIEMRRLQQVVQDLDIAPEVSLEVLSQVTRERLCIYIKMAEKERDDRREVAAIVKKMVQFNQLVVTPLLDCVRGLPPASRDVDDEEERHGQCEITLKADMDERSRAGMYTNYMMYTMTGDTVELPVGGMFRKKNNPMSRHAESARLAQLAGLLGMSEAEVAKCQHDVAEDAYKAQVSEVMRSGPLSDEKSLYLEELRTQLKLSKEAAEKVVRAAKSEVYGSAAINDEGGRWTLERVMEVSKAGGRVADMAEEGPRRNIFRKELEDGITNGTGELNAEFMLKKLPAMLGLEDRKIKTIVKELVASRKRMLLVQAVSQFRQKRPSETVASLQNLLSCIRVLPDKEPMTWSERAELKDIFGTYCSADSSLAKREEVRAILGLSSEEAHELGAASDSEDGQSGKKVEHEDAAFF